MTSTSYKYILEPYRGQRTRHTCPKCKRHKEFARYVDAETGAYLAEQVGKCNRESNCGYHYTPREYFRDHAGVGVNDRWCSSSLWQSVYRVPEEKPVDFISRELMEKTFCRYEANNFVCYLLKLFEEEQVRQLIRQFRLGTSRHWKNGEGLSVVFWQIDVAGRIRQAKVMAYDPDHGGRLKAPDKAYKWSRKSGKYYPDVGRGAKVFFAGKSLVGRSANLKQCFFGEHQLADRPADGVAIVESEKTAVIMSGFVPEVIWLATGGKNGARWTDQSVYGVLQNRKVIMYPDLGAYQNWCDQAKILGAVCEVSVSNLLERKAVGDDWRAGFDLVDYFTKHAIDLGDYPKNL